MAGMEFSQAFTLGYQGFPALLEIRRALLDGCQSSGRRLASRLEFRQAPGMLAMGFPQAFEFQCIAFDFRFKRRNRSGKAEPPIHDYGKRYSRENHHHQSEHEAEKSRMFITG